MFEVSKIFDFEAAHSLPYLPEGHKCRNLHGHSYRFEVVCRGELDDRGFVIDYAEISAIVDPVVAEMDHQNLEEIFDFSTTAENIARWLYYHLGEKMPQLYQIHFYETAKTRVTYPAL